MDVFKKLSKTVNKAIVHDSSCGCRNLWSVNDHCTCNRRARAEKLYDEMAQVIKEILKRGE